MKILLVFIFIFINVLSAHMLPPQLLKTLTLEQKIGQFFMIPITDLLESDIILAQDLIKNNYIGGIIFLGNNNPKDQLIITNLLQEHSSIPLLIGQDCEWGLAQRHDQVINFPKNMTLGAIQNYELLYKVGYEIGKQCKLIGVHINFAPVLDINNNRFNPIIGTRSFGDDPKRVAQAGIAYAAGMQDAGTLACAKHFPGHGDTAIDSHFALPIINHTYDRIDAIELYPFKQIIQNTIPAIMVGHISLPTIDASSLPATLSSFMIKNILREKLKFKGLIITDALRMKAINDHFGQGTAEVMALKAGNDIVLCPANIHEAITAIKKAIDDSIISQEEIDEHVLRILELKESLGLYKTAKLNPELLPLLHTAYAQELKKELYRNALTLITNHDQLLPLTKNQLRKAVLVQMGKRMSIFEHYCYQNGVTLLKDDSDYDAFISNNHNNHELIIISLSNLNNKDFNYYGISAQDRNRIQELSKTGLKIIIVIFGTPYALHGINDHTAIIIAYEEDPDAQQAAFDVLSGIYKPRGLLPITLQL